MGTHWPIRRSRLSFLHGWGSTATGTAAPKVYRRRTRPIERRSWGHPTPSRVSPNWGHPFRDTATLRSTVFLSQNARRHTAYSCSACRYETSNSPASLQVWMAYRPQRNIPSRSTIQSLWSVRVVILVAMASLDQRLLEVEPGKTRKCKQQEPTHRCECESRHPSELWGRPTSYPINETDHRHMKEIQTVSQNSKLGEPPESE